MRKTIFGCLGAAAVAFALQFTQADVHAGLFSTCSPCDEVCNPCDDTWNCDPCDAVCGPSLGKWFLNGHMEAGFWSNAHGATSTYDGAFNGGTYNPVSGNTAFLPNTRLTGAQINQVYISAGKKVDGRRGLDIGGTVDFTWGADAWQVQAGGLEKDTVNAGAWRNGDYYSAFAQAYAEAAYGRWNVYAGKFHAPFRSSAYKSTDNFFYTWAQTSLLAPHTAGGAYATYKASNSLTLIGGWVMPDEIGRSDKNNAFLGGAVWTPSQNLSLRYTFAAGSNTYAGNLLQGTTYDVFVQTLLATVKLSSRLTNTFEWTLLNINTGGASLAAAYGLNNELIYRASKNWAFGSRFGYFNASAGAVGLFGFEDPDAGVEWYTVSLGANWTPNKWLTVKPEIRYDWTNPLAPMFNVGASDHQFSGGLSTIVKF